MELRISLSFLISLLFALPISAKEIAISFDDGPSGDSRIYNGIDRTKLLVSSLAEAGVSQAIFFVNGKNIDSRGKKQLKLYTDAGHLIGNHTYHHSNLAKVSIDEYLGDIRKGHEAVRGLPGFTNLFRYPHLAEGDTLSVRDRIRTELNGLGYRNGYVTVDNYDFYMNTLVTRQLEAEGRVDFKKLRDVYVDVLVGAAEFYDKVALKALGRSPKHILLLHENDLAAMYLVDLVKGLKSKGWSIISAESAYSDPIADDIPDTLYNGQGRVAALAKVKLGKEFRSVSESTEYLDHLFEAHKIFK